jgi:hypothetical protein
VLKLSYFIYGFHFRHCYRYASFDTASVVYSMCTATATALWPGLLLTMFHAVFFGLVTVLWIAMYHGDTVLRMRAVLPYSSVFLRCSCTGWTVQVLRPCLPVCRVFQQCIWHSYCYQQRYWYSSCFQQKCIFPTVIDNNEAKVKQFLM